MIQEIKFKNFMSFRDEVTLSFEATKDTTFEDYHVVEVTPGVRLLRFAMVYGANASGKSNLLQALDFLHDFLFSRTSAVEQPMGTDPFRLDVATPGEPSEFSLRFYVGEVRYWYELKLTQSAVLEERLYYYKSVQPTKIFDRNLSGGQSVITFNPAVVKLSAAALEEITLKCLPNMSVFAAKSQVNIAIEPMDVAREWLRNGIMPMVVPTTRLFDYASSRMHGNSLLKSYLLEFIHQADFNITDVKTDKVMQTFPPQVVQMLLASDDTPDDVKESLRKDQGLAGVQTQFEHTVVNSRGSEKYILPTESQSDGTRRTLGIEAAVYEALEKQAFLFIDEIEASLHPELVEFILQKFLQTHSRAQLLVTTHYDPLLATVGDDLIRRDSVWFTEKDPSGSTNLYSLVEYKGLNRIASLQKAYRNGLFGALPNIKG